METTIVYKESNDLISCLKRDFRPFKSLIKSNTTRERRFPVVKLDNCPKLDRCAAYVDLNGYNDSIDDRINRISKKLLRKLNETDVCDESDFKVHKKRKIGLDSDIDLKIIYNENEELDFEEENIGIGISGTYKNGSDWELAQQSNGRSNGHKSAKLNGFSKKWESNGNTSDSKRELKALSVYSNNCNNGLNFKIPKKDSQNIESIVSHAKDLNQNRKRCVEAFTHLQRYLTEDHWKREDVIELLANIGKGMASNPDLSSQMTKFNDLMDKMKSLVYIDEEFWDQIIYSVDKKKNDIKCSHQISSFLSGLYDYMMDHKIAARVLCTEAVIIAYRSLTNHPTVKDLLEIV